MIRFLTFLSALAMVASLAVAPQAALAKHHGHDGDHMNNNHRKCLPGQRWVPAHRDHGGRWIQAHCQIR